MAIVQYPQVLAGQVGVIGATKFMVTTDNFATITTAGYLNNIDLAVYPILSSDTINILYSYNLQTNTGTLGTFTVSISQGIITLVVWANPGDVLLPVVDGDFASFNGTSGQIKDSGITPTNPARPKVASINGAGINHIAVYSDASGTIGVDAANAINGGNIQAGLSGTAGILSSFPSTPARGSLRLVATNNVGDFTGTITNGALGQNTTFTILDPLVPAANILLDQGLNKLQPNSLLVLDHVDGTEVGGTLNLTGQSGFITTSSLTAAAGTKYTFTWNNSNIAVTSVINLFWMGGTNIVNDVQYRATAGAGVSTVDIFNNSPVDALNGTMIFGYTIF